ncbi:MAG: YceD family protein [Candidatus Dactylopiibacterium sp.]|nr:YceD family protein [Candidatus Dactylopiibacterium sp.]
MSHQPRVISDPYEFARRGFTLAGEAEVREFSRLAGVVREAGLGASVAYEVRGVLIEGKAFLDVVARVGLVTECQRCLADVTTPVEAGSRLLLVPPGEDLPDEDLEEDAFDPVHVWRDFDVLGAVEEELLLALPLAPTHVDCSVPVARENGDDSSPFAVLRGLKLPGKRDT